MLKTLGRKGAPAVWLMRRLWIADQRGPYASPVRLSLPWHGEASWDDMHDYVAAVISENTVPSPDYTRDPAYETQADKLARSILLSVCHRLGIEPVGAFDFHNPDHQEKDE